MCNDAIRIALDEEPGNRFELIELAYPRLKEYGLHTHYILSACEVAYSVYRNKKRKSRPFIRRAFLKVTSQSYLLNHLVLRIPTRPRHFIYLTLQASNYHLSLMNEPALKHGAITITKEKVVVAISKRLQVKEVHGQIGVDVNEKNVTFADSAGNMARLDTSQITELKERYREIRAKISKKTQKDRRVQRRLLQKYGRREKNRTVQRIHVVTKRIAEEARKNQFGIVMEKLKGIRRLYRKGNGQGGRTEGDSTLGHLGRFRDR